jgi:hypothetical protein
MAVKNYSIEVIMIYYDMDGYRSQDNTNKKVVNKFKDETNKVPIVEFVFYII